MAKDDNQVDDQPVEEVTADETTTEEQPAEQPDDIQVELDRASDVGGDLIENPKLEEVDDEPESGTNEGTAEDAGEGEPGEEVQPTETTEDDKSAEPAEEPTETDEAGVYAEPVTTDPGEFQLKGDYSFEVTTMDGKTHKISNSAEADAFAAKLDDNPELVTVSQFTKFNRGVAKMDVGIDREQAEFERQKEQFETQERQAQVRNEQITQWNNEINYLRTKGLLPEITPELNSSDWTDPKNAEQPAVKETLAIFKWMEKENADRRSAGIPEVTNAVDAFNMMRAEQQEAQVREEATQEKSLRQKKGAMIGGNAQFTPDSTPAGTIIGTGGTLRELELEAQNNLG